MKRKEKVKLLEDLALELLTGLVASGKGLEKEIVAKHFIEQKDKLHLTKNPIWASVQYDQNMAQVFYPGLMGRIMFFGLRKIGRSLDPDSESCIYGIKNYKGKNFRYELYKL